jgi:hypothetical protein
MEPPRGQDLDPIGALGGSHGNLRRMFSTTSVSATPSRVASPIRATPSMVLIIGSMCVTGTKNGLIISALLFPPDHPQHFILIEGTEQG